MKLLFLIFLIPLQASASPTSATLLDAFQSALAHTESNAIQESLVAQSEERTSQAVGSIYPNITLQGNYTRQETPSTSTSGTSVASSQQPDQTTIKLNLTQPIFHGFRDWAAYRAAKDQNRAQQATAESARASLYNAVGQAYFTAMANESDYADVGELAELSRRRADEIRARVRTGQSKVGDLLSAETQVQSSQALLLSSKAALDQSRETLAYVTGLPADAKLGDASPLPEKLDSLENYMAKVESRPDVLANRELAAAADEQVPVARGQHYGTLDFSGNYYLRRTGILADTKWDFGLTFVFPIFQGGVVQSQVRQASETSRAAELTLTQSIRNAKKEILIAYQAADSALRQAAPLKLAADAADKNYKQATRDYRNGLVNNLEVLQALNDYISNKRALDRNASQVRLALVGLEAATGKYPGGNR